MNSWLVAGLIAGVVVYIVDYVMWGKVFTKGMESFADQLSPEQMKAFMGPALMKSAVLSLLFGLVFAFLYGRLRTALWVEGGGPIAGMEFGTVLWLPILFVTLGGSIWWTRVRALHRATMLAWLVRVNAAGLAVGFLMK
jgi:F0F1-type ATP synthase membrane subunit c/vacuolar-type H+-ATPase subunit K